LARPTILSTFHSDNFGGYIREKLLTYTDIFTQVNTAVSRAVAEKLVDKGISPKDKIKVIYNGVDLDNFTFRNHEKRRKVREELGIKKGEKLIISVGRLNKIKGHSYLIESFKRLKKKQGNTKLIILGEGEERSNLQEKVQSLGLAGDVLLLGKRDNVSDYLHAADLFISSSVHEGFGLSIAEAMACGTSVIATDVGGVSELIKDEETGFLAEPENVDSLTNKMENLLDLSNDNLKRIMVAARKSVEERFSTEEMVQRYEDLYK
jgi:N-acetyl-alpha-D-glucosaminyl L-malate synthase BshA